jgi:fructokinase
MFVVGGESLIDLVPEAGEGVLRFAAHAGGSPYNCAIALARLGAATGFLCPISADALGTLLLAPLEAAGVAPLLTERVAAPTSLAVVALDAAGKAAYSFYRAADRAFSREGLIAALPAAPELFQIGGFCPILPEDAAVWREVAATAAARGAVISIDANVRPSLVADFTAYAGRLRAFFDMAQIIKVSDEDLLALEPGLAIEAHAESLLARPRCELVVVTRGERGALALSRSGRAEAGVWRPPVFGDTVGAGDCMMAGVLAFLKDRGALAPGRLAGLGPDALVAMLRFGAVVAGLNCGERGCVPPGRAAVEAALAG